MDKLANRADVQFQQRILIGVSRTFALTIPELPSPLCDVVGSAYLLCRIVDTIEDDAALTTAQKDVFYAEFVAVVNGISPPEQFAQQLHPLLAQTTLAAERELVKETASVMRLVHSYTPEQQAILRRTIEIMGRGMPIYGRLASTSGLPTMHDLDKYCYYVAGVVGEMLTELFCDYAPEIAAVRAKLRWLAVSFGQALQMTNILKDIWEDYARGVCWLPCDLFQSLGVDLSQLTAAQQSAQFAVGMRQLVATTLAHCRNALAFVQLIPAHHVGIRRFCLRALAMAILTLRKIHDCPNYTNKRQVTISRRTVQTTLLVTNLLARSNHALLIGLRMAMRTLPVMPLAAQWESSNLSEFT